MASVCNFMHNQDYAENRKMCGMSTERYDGLSQRFLDRFGRLPHIDEVPGASTERYLREELSLDKDGNTTRKKILEYTGAKDMDEALQMINNKHADLNVDIDSTGVMFHVNISKRANMFHKENRPFEPIDINTRTEQALLYKTCEDISRKYGVVVHWVSPSVIEAMGIHDGLFTKGFIKDGEIFINSQTATLDTPIHELMHLFSGAIKAHDHSMYETLVDGVGKYANLDMLKREYVNRSTMDLKEEFFVEEMSKFLVGQKSFIDKLDRSKQSEIIYLFTRSVDTVINGQISCRVDDYVNNIEEGMTLRDLGNRLKGELFNGLSNLLPYQDVAKNSRINQNKIQELMEADRLREECK